MKPIKSINQKAIEKELNKLEELGLDGIVGHIIATIRCAKFCNDSIIHNPLYDLAFETLRARGNVPPEYETVRQQVENLSNLPCHTHSLRENTKHRP